jgi:hypothetical protein
MPEPHKVTLVLGRGGAYVKLICPEGGCEPASACSECGRSFDDAEAKDVGQPERCGLCPSYTDECWVKTWFDNRDGAELYGDVDLDLAGRLLPLPIHCEFDGDTLIWHVLGASS